MDSDEECPDLIDIDNANNSSGSQGYGNMAKVPVTIITGHLGSGKTTLLNYVLNEQHNKKVSSKYCRNLILLVSAPKFESPPVSQLCQISLRFISCKIFYR